MIIGGSWLGKTSALLNLIEEQNDIDKIYMYAKDLSEPKYELLIKKHEYTGTKYVKHPNAFIECSNTMYGVYENIDDYTRTGEEKF